MTHVNEWRALRDAYAKRAVRSLARLNPAMGVESWQRYIEGAARFPHAHAESLALPTRPTLRGVGRQGLVSRKRGNRRNFHRFL
jgi:hypothetical protein